MAVSPQSPRRGQKIEMLNPLKWTIVPGERETCFDQRNIKGCAVVGNDQSEVAQHFSKREQHRGFFVEIANEKLVHMKLGPAEVPDTDQERTDPCSALHPGGFRIQKDNPLALARGPTMFHQLHQLSEFRR